MPANLENSAVATGLEKVCIHYNPKERLCKKCSNYPKIALMSYAWWAAVHGVTRSRTWLTDFTFTVHFHALEKEMATHSSVLAWRIPGTGEPGGLPSMGSHRAGHD